MLGLTINICFRQSIEYNFKYAFLKSIPLRRPRWLSEKNNHLSHLCMIVMQLLPLIQNACYDVSLIFSVSFWVFDSSTVLTELFFINVCFLTIILKIHHHHEWMCSLLNSHNCLVTHLQRCINVCSCVPRKYNNLHVDLKLVLWRTNVQWHF